MLSSVSCFRTQLLEKNQYTIIHDGDDQNSLECELETALEGGHILIVIEPIGLGDRSIRWIRAGNFLHKSAVLASLGALVTGPFLPPRIALFTSLPVGVFGVLCAFAYDLSWQFDPCCKYQVDYRGQELAKVPSHELQSRTPVVLVRRNDKYRKILHNTLALLVAGCVSWRLFKYYT